MSFKLVIVESPAKCKKIESFLGKGYRCAASFGHLRDLKNGLKGIDISNNFHPTFQILSKKRKYVNNLTALVKKSSEVILATDDDREGEAIAWHLCKIFKLSLKTTKRIIFHEITKDAILKAVKNPTIVNMDMVHAQQARQILDIIVGFKISPILWKNISRNTKQGLSAGRCQTPALRIIYDNQQIINDSKGIPAYDTIGTFTDKKLEFKLNYNFTDEDKMADFLETSIDFKHVYSKTKTRVVKKIQPKPFTTSSLQQKASNELHFSPKQTMKLAQTLYENGYITYMRTDSTTYSKEFIATAKSFIIKEYGENYILKDINKLSARASKKSKKDKNAQEAHEAIRPTKIYINIDGLSAKVDMRAKRLYALIRRNTLESCMAPAEFYSITGIISSPEKHNYRYTAELVKFPGWKIVGGYEKENPNFNFIKTLKDGKILKYSKIYSKSTLKELKTHFTEARLVQKLEKEGIGRPSTFSNLIAKIQDRGYVKKSNIEGKTHTCIDFQLVDNNLDEIEISRTFGTEKNKLIIEPIGIIVIEFLIKHFNSLFEYEYTKDMEDTLDKISKGNEVWHSLCKKCNLEIIELSEKISDENRVKIVIDENHTYMIGKYGPVIKCEINGVKTWKGVKKNIDMKKLKEGKYCLKDIVDIKKGGFSGRELGFYQDKEVFLKKGKFGFYINWNKKNYSISFLKKKEGDIVLQDVIKILSGEQSSNPNVLKIITEHISIRKGKYGAYVFYKNETMKKPRFLKLNKFDWKQHTAAAILTWIRNEYSI